MSVTLAEHFEHLGLPDDAREWLLSLWNVIQVFDDAADGDPIDRANLDAAVWGALYGMPTNPFYIRHAHVLLPLLAVQVLKWKASDTAERAGAADERSYMWRAGYYDLVLMAVQLCHGETVALSIADKIMGLYGDDFADYRKEFPRA